MTKFIIKPLHFFLAALLLTLIASLPFGIDLFSHHLDKLGHLAIFFCISLFINHTFKYGQGLITALLSAILFGFGIELLQEILPKRRTDILDTLANTLGIDLGVIVMLEHDPQ